LIIKIFEVRMDASTNTRTIALIAALYLRTSLTPLISTSVISFGTASPDQNTTFGMDVSPGNFIGVGHPDPINNNIPFPPCNASGIPTYTMNIPGTELFDGVPANFLPSNFNLGCNLDLWELQESILDDYVIDVYLG
jgi:hypothetical protein